MNQGNEHRLTIRQVHTGRRVVLVRLAGELDLDTVQALTEMTVRVAGRPDEQQHVLLNLSDITYCDPGALFTLLGLCHALAAVGIAITITETSPEARHAIEDAQLTDRLPLHPHDGPGKTP